MSRPNLTKIAKARSNAGRIAQALDCYADALHRFARGVETPEDRAMIGSALAGGVPCFPCAGLSYALRSTQTVQSAAPLAAHDKFID